MASDPSPKPARSLQDPLADMPNVGPARAELLSRMGLRTAADLLFFFPRDYQDLSHQVNVDQFEEDQLYSIVGVIDEYSQRRMFTGRTKVGLLVHDETEESFRAVWFYRPFDARRWKTGTRVLLTGKPKRKGLIWEMIHPTLTILADDEAPEDGAKVLPVYRLTDRLRQWEIRRVVKFLVENYSDLLDEVFPDDYLQSHKLMPICEALPAIHFPADRKILEQARGRFVYQELLVLQLALALRSRENQTRHRSTPLPVSPKIDSRIRRLFPFQPTDDQNRVIAEISNDLAKPYPMNRLLQGDVGTGKTAVAAYAMLATVAHGQQATLMAPTEVLARQHFLTFKKLLAESKVRIGLLTGGMKTSERSALLDALKQGEIDILIGTQAVIQEGVEFGRLGLAVIDEQHKFGVRQRAQLRSAAQEPHYLVMTATPIPRTVTMTLFGDLDISILREMPPGRQKVNTYLVTEELRDRWWNFFSEKLREGRQGYVVTPLLDESEEIEATSLAEAYEELVNGPLEAFRVGLIHGRMKADEKDAVMAQFRSGKLQVLVATSVIEVGVDIPNATLMTIESGQRFGLAGLHQLRGRIVRGKHPGFCGLFADLSTDESVQRIKAFVGTTDGFELAETDFSLRGPGELFGTRQHGLPPFRIADLQEDRAILETARADAAAMVEADPGLSQAKHRRLRDQVIGRYGKVLELADVG
jgi:ATP-dependent DNA helicase RecG